MMNRLSELLLTRLLWLVVIAVVVVSGAIAYRTHDGHWVNRGGALIASLAAGAVLLQIVIEMGLERKRHQVQSQHRGDPMPAISLLPMDALEERVKNARAAREIEDLDRRRLMIALRVVLCAMLGELLHGFGDLAICSLIVACVAH